MNRLFASFIAGVLLLTSAPDARAACRSRSSCPGPHDLSGVCYCPDAVGECACAGGGGVGGGAGGSTRRSGPPLKILTGTKASNYTLQPRDSSRRSRRGKWSAPSSYTSFRDATRALAAENWNDAARKFRDVLAYDRGNAAAYKGLGWALLKGGNPSAAIAELRAAVKLAPGDDQAKELLADALAANGAALLAADDADGADAAFREAAQLGDVAAKENARRVAEYRAALSARAQAERMLASSRTSGAAAAAQAGRRAGLAVADELASEEARRPFDTAGELVPPVLAEPIARIPASLAPASPTGGGTGAIAPPRAAPPIPPIPTALAAAAQPLLDKRAAADTRRTVAQAQIDALASVPASPQRDAALANARDASDRAVQERVFLDLAIAGTIRPSAATRVAVPDCRDAAARIARLDQGITSQEQALSRTKVILEQAAGDDAAARAAARERVISAAKDELQSVAGDFLSSARALRVKVKALESAGLARTDRREVLEAVKELEDVLDAMERAWSDAESILKALTGAPALDARIDALVRDTRTLEEKLAVVRNELVEAGLADQAGEFLSSRLAGPAGALAFRAARLSLDVGVLLGEASISAELRTRAEADYAILVREHQRVIRMRESLHECGSR